MCKSCREGTEITVSRASYLIDESASIVPACKWIVGNPTHTRFVEGAVIESGSLRHCEGNCNSDDDCGFWS